MPLALLSHMQLAAVVSRAATMKVVSARYLQINSRIWQTCKRMRPRVLRSGHRPVAACMPLYQVQAQVERLRACHAF